jgi:hypothetical protein
LGYQPWQLVKNLRFRDQFCPHHQDQILIMGTELVPETLIFNQLTRLIAQEDYINVSRRESLGSYKRQSMEYCKKVCQHQRISRLFLLLAKSCSQLSGMLMVYCIWNSCLLVLTLTLSAMLEGCKNLRHLSKELSSNMTVRGLTRAYE